MRGGNRQSPNTHQIPSIAEHLDLILGEAGDAAVELLVLSVPEENHRADAILDVGGEFLDGAGGEGGTLAAEALALSFASGGAKSEGGRREEWEGTGER